ncbi:exo-alpha-sialidase [Nonomuraea maritima]|uniref:exo-alpha-sialidase n=1 Tax=Nonomuraea maritima TaxID=683260 RepID=UPI00371C597A
MRVTAAVVTVMSMTAWPDTEPVPPPAGTPYCVLSEDVRPAGPDGTYLIDSASSPGWIQPQPAPPGREPTPSERLAFAGFPNVSVFDVTGPGGVPAQKVMTTYATNLDEVITLMNGAAISGDGGVTFGETGETPLRESPIELHDGRYFATEYYPDRTGPYTARLGILTSSAVQAGESWLRTEATLHTPDELMNGGAAYGRPVQLADGTILVTVYARYVATGTYQAELYASDDGGVTFHRRGVIARPAGGLWFTEASVAQTLDGSLLAVVRRDGAKYSTLHQARSHDGGRTWTPLREVRFAGMDCVVRGVAPRLLLTPGGLLVLSAGRPDNWLAVSPDGLGEEWMEPRVTYHNRDGIWDAHGSSGYTGIAAVGPHRLIQVVDNCKLPGTGPDGTLNETACPAHGKFEHGGWYGIRRLLFTVATPGRRLDLDALRRSGELRVSTTMNWTSPYRPRSGPAGALDGSTGYWSSAVATGVGSYELHFDRPRRLSRIGLSLRPGHPAGARVYASADGRSWGEPVVTIRDRTDHAMRYSVLDRTARHLRIVTEPTLDCDPEIGASCSMLNEVELYS